MALATATLNHLDVNSAPEAGTVYTVVTIQEAPNLYAALAQDFGIASDGPSAFEAALNVKRAVLEAMAVAKEHGVNAGEPVDDATLLEFLSNHQGPDPVSSFAFLV